MMNAARAPAPRGGLQRAMLTICAMTATVMQALDTTVANVALPYMQGSLSASIDQVNWVLTSYIVASAIMTAPVGWMAGRFGRKTVFLVCTVGFTFASLLCGLAQSIEEMVLCRLLQGIFGAGLIPLSQAVMLDSYSAEDRGQAMAIWGMGVMLGPVMGPTLGGWLTDVYNWRWVFLINLPIGIITVIGLVLFMDQTEKRREMRFDWLGFVALAVGIGAMQVMLDRGQQLGWFGSSEIVAEFILAVVGFYYFFAHSLTTPDPFVRFELFQDRNFIGGCFFMGIIGITVFATMTLSALFLQTVIGYPVMSAGLILAARGAGTMGAMLAVGWLLKLFEARSLIFVGMVLTAATLHEMVGFTNMTAGSTIVVVSIVQGIGLGLVFVPLSTVAFTTLPAHLRTDGSAILTLVRNIGSSIGIPVVIATLVNSTTVMHAQLAEYITPFNTALQIQDVLAVIDPATDAGRALIDNMLTQQATIIGFSNSFKLLMILSLVSLPFLLIIGSSKVKTAAAGPSGEAVHAMD
jgi:MFS transporter, DHA2 family, multidrug resistance protein